MICNLQGPADVRRSSQWRRSRARRLDQSDSLENRWSTSERFPVPVEVYVDACLRSSRGPEHDLLVLRRADKRDTAGTFPLVVMMLSIVMKASDLGLIKVLGKTPPVIHNQKSRTGPTHSTSLATVFNSAALSKRAMTAARRRATCDLMDVNMVPNSVNGHASALARLWSPMMAARYGKPPAPSTICRWRTYRRLSSLGFY